MCCWFCPVAYTQFGVEVLKCGPVEVGKASMESQPCGSGDLVGCPDVPTAWVSPTGLKVTISDNK